MGHGGNGGNGHGSGNPLVVLSNALLAETLEPGYAPGRDGSAVIAPVLALEGLEPWAVIQGPALGLEEMGEDAEQVPSFDDPAQLVLEPFESPDDAFISGESPTFELEDADVTEPAAEALVPSDEEEPIAEVGSPAPEVEALEEPAAVRDAVDVAGAAVVDAVDDSSEGEELISADNAVEELPAAPVDLLVDAAAPVTEVAPPAPDPAEVLYAEARDAAEAGRAEDAKRLYRQLLALHPAHVRARNNLALMLDAEGNHQGALAELDRALDVESENGTLLVNRGALLGAMGRYAAAERDLKKVLRVEPSHAEALFNLGVVMTKKGLWGEAVPHLKRAVELEPQRAAAHYYLGEALNHVDDLAGALAAYQRAAELQPANPRALYGLGIIYDRLARPDDAAQMYRRSREVGRR